MRLAILCGTKRGESCLRRIAQLLPEAELVVGTFHESPREPKFFDRIKDAAAELGAEFFDWDGVMREGTPVRPSLKRCDLMLAINWRFRLDEALYRAPRLGTFVLHDSLLPKNRGFSPTVWALVKGESESGATLFEIAEEIDAGDIVDQQPVPIGVDEMIGSVMERMEQAYLSLLDRNIHALLEGTAPRSPQDHRQATWTRRRRPVDDAIDFNGSAESVFNLIRGVSRPYAGAFTFVDGQELRVWSAARCERDGYRAGAGEVVETTAQGGAVVTTGGGPIELLQVQIADGPEARAAEVLRRGMRLVSQRA